MTKMVRDNFTGEDCDEEDSIEFTFIDRNFNGKKKLGRVTGDVGRDYFVKNLYANMVKKPKYEQWVYAVKDDDGKVLEKGYWEKVA